MFKKRMSWLIVPGVILASVVVGALLTDSQASELQPRFLLGGEVPSPKPQVTRERVWKPAPSRQRLILGEDPKALLFFPSSLQEDREGNIYVKDGGDQSVKKFSPEGRFLHKYGEGEGQGPGEFGALTDFVLTNDGALWAADASNGRIMRFAGDGRLLSTITMRQPPYRLAVMGGDRLAIMFPPSRRSFLFGTFNYEAGELKQKKEFGRFLENQEESSLALEGWLEPNGEGGFIYAALFPGLLASYAPEGRLKFLVQTIDPPPFPKIKRREDGYSFADRESRYSALSLSVAGDEIYILTLKEEGFKRLGVIDTYRRKDGTYLYSTRIPAPSKSVVVTDRYLYTLDESHVTQWLR